MSQRFTESVVEQAALAWLESTGYLILPGPDIAPGESMAEREDYGQVVLERRLRQALQRLNLRIPADALEEALRKLTRPDSPSLVANNHALHRMLVEGIPVEMERADGSRGHQPVWTLDFENPENNEFLAVNQFTVVEDQHERRPDVALFVNGLPLAVIELKNPADEQADVWKAFNQIQTYKQQIPSLFAFNEAQVISDGVQARIGTLTADREWFMPWRTIEGEQLADTRLPQLQVVLEGVFEKRRFLDLIRHFIVFEDTGGGVLVKKMAGYHQYHAVNAAVEETVRALAPHPEPQESQLAEAEAGYRRRRSTQWQPCGEPGDRRIGVVWHTQGSGKSLTMAFYAGRIVLHPAMENPTLVVITDRNDLDDQLYGTFARCHELLRQPPAQAQSREHLRELLRVASGGVVFTTIQKFMPAPGQNTPPLSRRRNIVVIADEAHRSQYDFIDGFARHMRDSLPNASFIGFTGTPIDIFAAAGLKKPDISILSDEFLADVRGMPQRNLAVEMLRKLLEGEIKTHSRKNVILARSFAEMLEKSIKRYQSRAIEAAQVIEELIALAKDVREANHRGEALGLTEDEVAFYDALGVNDSAVAVLGDETLRLIAQELVKAVRNSVTIDWTVRENVRAQMRVIIKRILRRYGYPPDKQARATELVLEQAEVLCRDAADNAA